MPVVRNPQFYFKEGLCWIFTLNESSEYQKARYKEKTVNDVNAMALYTLDDSLISTKFLVTLFNSYFIFLFKRVFINSSSAFQINDARLLPIIIPNKQQLKFFEKIFDKALYLKNEEQYRELNELQKIIDIQVEKLYLL